MLKLGGRTKFRSIAPLTTPATDEFLDGWFKTRNAGAAFIIEALPSLFTKSVRSMAGRYGLNELKFILDCFTGQKKVNPYMSGSQIIALAITGLQTGKGQRWGVDESIMKKLHAEPAFNLVVLEIWATKFWVDGNDADEWIAKLA